MIVVSDTAPITSLLQIGRERVLPDLYGNVIIPQAVERELRRAHLNLPAFLKIAAAQDREAVVRLQREIDVGEAEAIVVAKEVGADALLIDERRGRALARREGVPIIGLLGVLVVAKKKNLITSLAGVLTELEDIADFRFAALLKARALREVGELR